jgi:cytochrome c oxidase cbb3-type subunit IV
MTYDTVAMVSQVTTLLLFILMFVLVIGYVFWPGNRGKFDKAARVALEADKTVTNPRDRR